MTLAAPPKPTVMQAFWYWLKLGFISFGGPAGQIALMHTDLVERKRWISEKRFLHALNFCMVLPGPEAIQLAIYISWLMHGVVGAIMAGVLFFLPAFAILSGLAWVYLEWGNQPLVQGLFYGIKPAVVAVVLFAAWRIGSRVLNNPVLWGIATFSLLATLWGMGFPWVVVVAALMGVLVNHYYPEYFKATSTPVQRTQSFGKAVVDDDTPSPSYAQFSWFKFCITISVFVAIWAGVLYLIAGQDTLKIMGEFFTKAAFLTIGGAYAVLPYVSEAAVKTYGWLTAPQMMDGLALGESTPGPLIMIVTWIGYLGGVAKAVAVHPMIAGLMGAGVATFFTFLPSFMFILMGAPIVESTRNTLKLTAPLTAITAAVVGVIVNLALFFAYHTFWQSSTSGSILTQLDWFAVALAIVAFIALWKYKVDVIWVIVASALLGLLGFQGSVA